VRQAPAIPPRGVDAMGSVVLTWERVHGVGAMTSYGLGIAVSDDGRVSGAPQKVPDSTDSGGGPNGGAKGG
jgi:hypothetical protein